MGQSLAQGLGARRQDKDGLGLGHQPAYLLGALPVDFQNQVVAVGEGLLDPALGRAVEVAEDFGMLEKLVALETVEEILTADEVVVDPIHLRSEEHTSELQ